MTDSSAENPALRRRQLGATRIGAVGRGRETAEPSRSATRSRSSPSTRSSACRSSAALVGARRARDPQPGHTPRPPGRPGSRASGSTAKMTTQIADHVASPVPHDREAAAQLVAVVPTDADGHERHEGVPICGDRDPPGAAEQHRHPGLPVDKTRTVQLLRPRRTNCSIAAGKATHDARPARPPRGARGRALHVQVRPVGRLDRSRSCRRRPGRRRRRRCSSSQKRRLKDQLKQPLNKTLPLPTPPLPTEAEDLAEAATIDKLTLPSSLLVRATSRIETGGAR